ncbi:undecaprenyldiphospho-muramoylpentapeptide beta-N-acetylglucosaminyltransferase [Veillonella sp. VA139]|uniref:undecaprenyldiphospho-muramoylpentapeptide beta-N-acetylglucosaminyltransferase n=1 Tax=Veillonella sp. VA139 TaxID=741830 RepID=UPI000F8CFB66|nr:undecaprenyldiphospho-muramoylpentapeptide beta-N-acetylglucosaminyltransferase [Veillonella sp. VA139]
MNIMISGGGTGGHIYPALTIYKTLETMVDGKFLYVGTERGLESRIVPKEGIPFTTLPVQGLQRKLSLDTLVTAGKTVSSLWKANQLISDFKPDIVIGTGGYVCGPLLLAAALRGIPTLIQEQNVVPGITNKILSQFVDVVAVGYEEAIPHFPKAKQVVYTGNPVRPNVVTANREEARAYFGLQEGQTAILVAGGSRGARSINTAMQAVHEHYKGREDIKIIHATGTDEYSRVCESLGIQEGEVYSSTSHIVPYLDNMDTAMAASDMAIFRSGAIGLAELAVRGIPSILIPYPYAAADHQTFNAKAFVDAGASTMIVDKELNGTRLLQAVDAMLEDQGCCQRMGQATLQLGKPEAAIEIAKLALSIKKS